MSRTSSAELVDELPQPGRQAMRVVPLPQHARDLARLHARRDQVDPPAGRADAVRHVERNLADLAIAEQEVVQRSLDVRSGKTEEHMDPRRLDVGVDHPDAATALRRGSRPRWPWCSTCRYHRENCESKRWCPPSALPPSVMVRTRSPPSASGVYGRMCSSGGGRAHPCAGPTLTPIAHISKRVACEGTRQRGDGRGADVLFLAETPGR